LAFSNRGASYNGKGDYYRALLDLDQAIRLNPYNGLAYAIRAVARIGSGDFDQAIADSDEAIRLNPTDASGYGNRCFALTRKGDFDRAIASCNQAIQLNPKLANAFASRCTAWLESGDVERALADCDEAVRLNPDYAAGYTNRGTAFERKGEREKAITDFRAAVATPQRSLSGRWAQDEARKRLNALLEASNQTRSQPMLKTEEGAKDALPKMPPLNPDRRFALLLGNAGYPDADVPLKHPIRDARDLAAELRRTGFIVDLQENLGKSRMRSTIDAFMAKIAAGSAVLFFYSGYGVQVGRQTYLIPVDAQIWREDDVRRDGIDLESLLTQMNERRAIVKLVVIDASRRNPFERRFRGYSAGLGAVNVPDGTALIYSAAPGQVADDSDGQNNLLVAEVLKGIGATDLSAQEVLNRARIGVSRASGGAQVPWMSTTLIDEFYFARTNTASTVSPEKPAPPPPGARSKVSDELQ
jgi:tetratricopeptide (TPR) repeat protein